ALKALPALAAVRMVVLAASCRNRSAGSRRPRRSTTEEEAKRFKARRPAAMPRSLRVCCADMRFKITRVGVTLAGVTTAQTPAVPHALCRAWCYPADAPNSVLARVWSIQRHAAAPTYVAAANPMIALEGGSEGTA